MDNKQFIITHNQFRDPTLMEVAGKKTYSYSQEVVAHKTSDYDKPDHGALSDCELMDKQISFFTQQQPELLANLSYTVKKGGNLSENPFIKVDSHFKRGTYILLTFPLGPHPEWRNWELLASIDPQKTDLNQPLELKKENIKVFASKKTDIEVRWPENSKKFKEICPNIPIRELKENIEKNQNELIENYKIKSKKTTDTKNIIGNLVPAKFMSYHDKNISRMFHESEPEKKSQYVDSFEDKNLNYNAKLTIFRYWPSLMNSRDFNYVFDQELAFLESKNSNETPRVTYEDVLKDFDKLISSNNLSQGRLDFHYWYHEKVLALRANPNLWRVKND